MKRILVICLIALCLHGCGAQQTFETIGVVDNEPDIAQAWQMEVELPDELSAPVMESENMGKLYLCDDYTLIMQTFTSGDLNNTLMECTGYCKEELDLMETRNGGIARYEAVWTSMSETGDQIGRIAVLDDGNYHYVLTAMANAEKAGELTDTFQTLFRSFHIVEPGNVINSGS